MAECEVCKNEYDKVFRVTTARGDTHVFDSFECALHLLAPVCNHCGCRILGHDLEIDGLLYCCANCAQAEGKKGVRDRA